MPDSQSIRGGTRRSPSLADTSGRPSSNGISSRQSRGLGTTKWRHIAPRSPVSRTPGGWKRHRDTWLGRRRNTAVSAENGTPFLGLAGIVVNKKPEVKIELNLEESISILKLITNGIPTSYIEPMPRPTTAGPSLDAPAALETSGCVTVASSPPRWLRIRRRAQRHRRYHSVGPGAAPTGRPVPHVHAALPSRVGRRPLFSRTANPPPWSLHALSALLVRPGIRRPPPTRLPRPHWPARPDRRCVSSIFAALRAPTPICPNGVPREPEWLGHSHSGSRGSCTPMPTSSPTKTRMAVT